MADYDDDNEYGQDDDTGFRVALNQSAAASLGRNPEMVARMVRAARRLGVATSQIRHDNGQGAEHRIKRQEFTSLADIAPNTARFIAKDQDHAALMQDDLDNATRIEGALGYWALAKQAVKKALPTAGKGLNELMYGATALTGGQALARALGDKDPGKIWRDNIDWYNSKIKGSEKVKPTGRGQELAGMVFDTVAANAVTAPLGVAGKVPLLMGFAATAPGQLDDYLKAGYSPAQSAYFSLSNKSMEGLTELIGVSRLYKGGNRALKRGAEFMMGDMFGEQVNNAYSQMMDKGTLHPELTLQDFTKSVVDTAVVTLGAAGMQGAMMHPAIKASEAYQQHQQAQLNKNFMLALGESASESKLLKRLPEKFREYVAHVKQGGAVDNVYIPGEEWKTYWQEQGVDPAEMAESVVDGGATQYIESIGIGGNLVIPLEHYAEKIAPTEHHAPLLEHTKFHPGEATPREAETALAESNSEAEQLHQEAETADAVERSGHLKVFDDIHGQLQGIGYDRETARQYAAIAATRFKQRGVVLGVDSFDLYSKSPLRIVRPLPEGVQRKTVDMGLDPLLDRLRAGDIPTDDSIFGTSLLQFARERGVKDGRGDLKSMDVDKGKLPGKKNILRPDGLSLDKLREAAVEEGYLKEGATTADLLDAIDRELRGSPVYSGTIRDQKAHEDRMALDELKDHLDRVGLDYSQLSNEQVRRELYQAGQGGDVHWQSIDDYIDAGEIEPLHSVRDKDKLGELVKTMEDYGWIGRPILSFYNGEIDFALTGSHRIAAAKKAGIAIPVVRIDEDLADEWFEENNYSIDDLLRGDDEKKVDTLKEIGDGRAIALMEQEVGAYDDFDESTKTFKELKLYQSGTTKRGFFRTSPEMTAREIGILEKADASTFIHELGHSWLEELREDSALDAAPEQLRQDWETVKKWLGNDGGELTTEQHEQFARGAEAYVMEGKAPTVELQPVFQRMKAWLVNIYRTLAGLNVKLNNDVRGVFDRLLASEEEIKAAREGQKLVELFATKEDAGMTEAEFAAYRKQAEAAHVAETDKLQRAIMREVSREHTKWWKEEQAKIRGEVEEEAHASPVYRAIRLLSTGKMFDGSEGPNLKLSRADLVRMYGEPFLKNLPRGFGRIYTKEGGVHPDVVADMFGYESGDAMIREMIEAPPMKGWIEAETDLRMRKEHGDMLLDGTVVDEAMNAVHEDQREQVLRAELAAIKRQQRLSDPAVKAAKKDAKLELEQEQKERDYERRWMEAEKNLSLAIERGAAKEEIRKLEESIKEIKKAAKADAKAAKSELEREQKERAYERRWMDAEKSLLLDTADGKIKAAKANEVQGRRTVKESLPSREAFRLAAMQLVGAKKVGDISPALYLAAERKAGKEAFDAVAKKDWSGAAEAKRRQLMNFHLYREATAARDSIDAMFKTFDKLKKSDANLAKSRDVDMVNAARAILGRYGIDRRSGDAAAYLEKVHQNDPDKFNDLQAAAAVVTQDPKPWQQLTMDELNAVHDGVMNLWNLSRREKQVEIDGRLTDKDYATDNLSERLHEIGLPENRSGLNRALTTWDGMKQSLLGMAACMTRVEAWVDAMDGNKPYGVFRRYLWNPVSDGVNAYRVAKKGYITKYLALVKTIEKTITHDKIEAPMLGNGGYTFNGKAELLGALLHTGNESNLEKLLVGRGWGFIAEDGGLDTSDWDTFIDRMQERGVLTEADYNFIQSVWDLFEEIKPQAQKAHHQMYGYYFSEITAQPVHTRFGTYRGGYAPAIADSALVSKQGDRETADTITSLNNAAIFPSTGRGFTRERVKYNKPLVLDLRLVPSHIDKTMRFIHIEPHVKDVARLVLDYRLRDELEQLNPAAVSDLLIPWLQRTARQSTEVPSRTRGGRALDSVFREIRSRTGLQMMIANVSNTLQQFTGLALSAVKVGPRYLSGATWRYIHGPGAMAEEIAELSPFMSTRVMQSAFDTQKQAEDILINPSKPESMKAFFVRHGYVLQQTTQHVVDVITWAGAYDQAIAEGENNKNAVSRADSAVRMTQGSFNAEDMSLSETGSPLVKAFTQFYNYFNMQGNLLVSQVVGAARENGLKGAAPVMLKCYAAFAVAAIVSELIASTARGGPDPDDDGLDIALQLLVFSQLRTAAAMIPFGGNLANGVISFANTKHFDDRISSAPFASMAEALLRTFAQYPAKLIRGEEIDDRRAVRDVLNSVGMVTGVPVGPLGRPLGYLAGWNEERYDPSGTLDAARGLVTGTASRN